MKKFISFVMAAAMVASLVPATAFAKGDVTARAKIVDALSVTKDEARDNPAIVDTSASGVNKTPAKWNEKVPELQLTITSTDYRATEEEANTTLDVTVSLDNAEFTGKDGRTPATATDLRNLVTILYANDRTGSTGTNTWEKDETVTGTLLRRAGDADITIANLTAKSAGKASVTWLAGDGEQDWVLPRGTNDVWFDANGNGNKDAGDVQLVRNGQVIAADGDFYDAVTTGGAKFYATDATLPAVAFADEIAGFAAAVGINNPSGVGANPLMSGGFAAFELDTPATQLVAVYKAIGYEQGKLVTAGNAPSGLDGIAVAVKSFDKDEVTYTFTGRFAVDDIILIDLDSLLDKRGIGRNATVSVSSKAVEANDLVYVSVKGRDISATTKKVASIAEEEIIGLDSDIKVSSAVGDFANGQWFELKLSKGFEFNRVTVSDNSDFDARFFDGNTAYVRYSTAKSVDDDVMIIDSEDIDIESTSAKSGSTCTMTVKALDKVVLNADGDLDADVPNAFTATTTVEIMKVVDYKVELTVDEDEDVPVIYSGVNVDNYGITDDSDHMSLEVTAKETFPGAWSMRKGFNFELPEHVYVTDVDVVDTDNFYREGRTNGTGAGNVETEDVKAAFWNAYQDGKHVNFEFEKRVFDDVDSGLRDKECAEMTFKLELVADPGFVGDVVLKLTGELVDEQEVTIAKFVSPYEVKAEQNDLIIDYRYTDVPTSISITEAEKGLWAKNEAEFRFFVERQDYIQFEDDPTFEIDSKSGLEIKDDKASGGTITFTVKTESDEPATVTMKDMQLFMQRSIPAGPYDLKIGSSLADRYNGQTLWAPDNLNGATQDADGASKIPVDTMANRNNHVLNGDDDCDSVHNGIKADSYVGCVADYSTTVKEAFVNVVTAGRDVDDASFTTKVVVPVGENYIVAGEKQIELDTPAYINEAGYTMLPIRAVATALGINNNNVLWDQPTKTVTILYGQRIITMTQGQKVVYVNGSAIPASAAVENTNSRTFLPMRDLATALGVTDITWDQATRTATLNGNQTTSAK